MFSQLDYLFKKGKSCKTIRNSGEALGCGFFVFLQPKAQQVVIYDNDKEDYDY